MHFFLYLGTNQRLESPIKNSDFLEKPRTTKDKATQRTPVKQCTLATAAMYTKSINKKVQCQISGSKCEHKGVHVILLLLILV